MPDWLEAIRVRGDLGVELFFAISGFLVMRSLTTCYLDGAATRTVARRFLVRRLTRIGPGFVVTLTTLLLLSLVVPSLGAKVRSIADILWSFPTYAYNYAKPLSAGEVPGALNVFWSLCFEEQFYLLLIACFALLRHRLGKALVWLGVGSVLWRVAACSWGPLRPKTLNLQMYTHLRLDAILLGCLLWIHFDLVAPWLRRQGRGLLYAMLLLTAGVLYLHDTQRALLVRGLNYLGVSITATYWVHHFLSSSSLPARLLASRGVVYVGAISYEIYLTHQLVNGLFAKTPLKDHPGLFTLTVLVASTVLAALFYRYCSRPIQRYLRVRLRA